ncbi:MAG: hypothetical protein SF051_12355 [Elusimicrobiota bacterium]|nr:hypothetical protein [Elusimicrobiota bacterium]
MPPSAASCRAVLPCLVLLPLAVLARAQPIWVPPTVSTRFLAQERHPRVPPDEVASGDLSGLLSLQERLQRDGGVRRQDLAEITVVVRGEWFFTPEESAKEQAAAIGANYLLPVRSFGGDTFIGAERVYLAVRLNRYDGVPSFTRDRESVEGARRRPPPFVAPEPRVPVSPAPPPSPVPGPLAAAPRRVPGTLEWLWMDRDFVLSHRLGLDLSALSPRAWRDLERVVREHFPRAEHAALLRHRRAGARIVIDMRKRSLWTPS